MPAATIAGQAAWIDAAEVTPDDDAAVEAWLGDPGRDKVLHDAKGGILALALTAPAADGRPRFTAEQLIDLYAVQGPRIFSRSPARRIASASRLTWNA